MTFSDIHVRNYYFYTHEVASITCNTCTKHSHFSKKKAFTFLIATPCLLIQTNLCLRHFPIIMRSIRFGICAAEIKYSVVSPEVISGSQPVGKLN